MTGENMVWMLFPREQVTTQAMWHLVFYAPRGQNEIAQGATLENYDNTNAP
jgi:hypothetical protein